MCLFKEETHHQQQTSSFTHTCMSGAGGEKKPSRTPGWDRRSSAPATVGQLRLYSRNQSRELFMAPHQYFSHMQSYFCPACKTKSLMCRQKQQRRETSVRLSVHLCAADLGNVSLASSISHALPAPPAPALKSLLQQ